MTNSEQAIREFAVNNGHRIYFTDGDMDGFDADPRFISDLTALISEHYYPKKFVEWFINNPDKRLRRKTTDELYQYYKENEQ